MTRLDDLLTYEDEPRRRRSDHGLVFRVGSSIVVCAAGSWAIWLVLRDVGVGAPYVFVAGLTVTLVVLRAVLRGVAAVDLPATLRDVPKSRQAPRELTNDGMHDAVRRWESRLEWTHQDISRFAGVVQAAFADIVDERLRLSHGISRAGDPVRAEQLVGPQLWKFLHEPIKRSATPQEIAVLVAQMEAL
jgi:hypothetical protein